MVRPGGATRSTVPSASISTWRPPTAMADEERCRPIRKIAALDVPPPMSTLVTCS